MIGVVQTVNADEQNVITSVALELVSIVPQVQEPVVLSLLSSEPVVQLTTTAEVI